MVKPDLSILTLVMPKTSTFWTPLCHFCSFLHIFTLQCIFWADHGWKIHIRPRCQYLDDFCEVRRYFSTENGSKKAPFWEPLLIFVFNSPLFGFLKLFFNYCVHVTHNNNTLGLFYPIEPILITEKSQKRVEKNPEKSRFHIFCTFHHGFNFMEAGHGWKIHQDASSFISKLPKKDLKKPHFWNNFRFLAIMHQCFVVLGLFVI